MIILEFDAASFTKPDAVGRTDAGKTRSAFQLVPVLLQIGGVDLVAENGDADGATVAGGLRLSLIEAALWGLVALYSARRSGMSAYELNEHGVALLFQLKGDVLLVHSMHRERTVQVSYKRLLAVWEDFDDRVRRFLIHTFGNLTDYPWWNASLDRWLHGTLDVSAMAPPQASMRFLDECDQYFKHIDAVEA